MAAIAAILAAGCQGGNAEDEYEPAVVPKSVAFEGKVDAKYAGTWKSADGSSTLALAEDGRLKIESVVNSQNGKSTSKTEGKWLASGNDLLFQYGTTTLRNGASFEKGKLILQHGRMKTVYSKQ